MSHPMPRPLSDEQGFNLIEVMVAIAIFAFGILALAYLQLSIQKLDTNSQYITTANDAANQMTGYLWTALGNGSNTTNIMEYNNIQVSASAVSTTAGARLNVQRWQRTIIGLNSNGQNLPDTGLPQATGQVSRITCSATDGSNSTCSTSEPCACTAHITIQWQSRTGTAPETYQITVPVGF